LSPKAPTKMYRNSLIESITFILTRHSTLFDEDERDILNSIVALSDVDANTISAFDIATCVDAQTILSRMILRKGSWMKSVSFLDFLKFIGNFNNAASRVDLALKLLREKNIVDIFDPCKKFIDFLDMPFDEAWNIAESCFSVSDISVLHQIVSNCKSKVSGKANMLASIKMKISGQSNVFGKSLKERFPYFLIETCKKIDSVQLIARIKPNIAQLLRRVQRLNQVNV